MHSLRIAIAGLIISLASVLPGRAGDAATLEVLGFSADGGLFAFEQYGIQDGSGFPYSERFYIDTATDSWLPGTPIRVRIEDETASLESARQQARTQGQSVIADSELAANRGHLAGYNPVTELSGNPHRMQVNPRPVLPPVDDPLEFLIEEIHLTEPPACEGLGEIIMGLRLVRIDASVGGTTELVHEDSSIPASRGCPLGYRLGAIQTFFPNSGSPVYAVMIAIRSFGFEGPDHRWIAIPGPL